MSVGASGGGRWPRAVVAAALVVAGLAGAGRSASAQCEIVTDDGTFDIRDAGDPGDAIVLRTDESVTVTRPDDGALGVVVWFGPLPIPLPILGGAAEETSTADLADVDWLGVGLYRVELIGPGAGECAGTFWVRVEGAFPLLTVAGAVAVVATILGGALLARAVQRGRRQRCSIARGVIGGVLAGSGGAFLAQQFGVLPMLVPIIVICLIAPALIGGLVARSACASGPVTLTLSPLLAAPLVVEAGSRFDVRVGVAVRARSRRRGADQAVTVQVVTAGAAVDAGGAWRRTLAVRRDRADAEIRVAMRASRDVGASHLTVFYASEGQTVGMARRPLWVVEPGGLPPPDVDRAATTVAAPFDVPVGRPAVDLELRASYAGPRSLHVLQWTAESPHRDRLAIPDAPVTVDLGGDPEAFAAGLLVDVSEGEGRAGAAELMLGAGRQLARTLGPAMMQLLQAVHSVGTGPPRVLLLTEESSVPWELVAVEPAPAGVAPFLATRAVCGRWFLAPGAVLPPPVSVTGGDRRVVATEVLPAAASESRRLQAELGFHAAPPTVAGVLDALEQAATVHLACHGSWRFEQARCFLELADGRLLPRHVAGLRLDHHPFVFLNACQVAAGGEALGTPTGFPAELVLAGASGCVVPLWSVRDDQAYEIAVAFIRAALAGRPPAEVLREQRSRAAVAGLASSTPFAYQFCGHPDLQLVVAPRAARTA